MDHLMCPSLSHIHYWYELGMWKVSEGCRDSEVIDSFLGYKYKYLVHCKPSLVGPFLCSAERSRDLQLPGINYTAELL